MKTMPTAMGRLFFCPNLLDKTGHVDHTHSFHALGVHRTLIKGTQSFALDFITFFFSVDHVTKTYNIVYYALLIPKNI